MYGKDGCEMLSSCIASFSAGLPVIGKEDKQLLRGLPGGPHSPRQTMGGGETLCFLDCETSRGPGSETYTVRPVEP